MSPRGSVRSIGNLVWIAISLALGASGPASAALGDCMQIDAKGAASILGVPVRATANQGHSKLPPDNTDLLSCLYLEATPSPTARMLTYQIYTPIPKDLASVYASVANGNFPRKQVFTPNVGEQSSGWFRSGLSDSKFEGSVAMQSGTTVLVIKIAGMPSSDAVKNALISAGKILAKP